jgi:hypothetical protein
MAFKYVKQERWYVCLTTDTKLAGDIGAYLYEFNETTGERTVYQNKTGLADGWVLISDNDLLGVVQISAGAALIGKVGIDQTTDGTTNKVQARNATHDNFNSNANIQVGDADVANGNPVPISDAGNSITIDQSIHDNLNGNMNLQIGDSDNSSNNPLFASLQLSSTPISNLAPMPISDAAGSLTVDQSTRSNFNANASLQLAGVDVTSNNAIPVILQLGSTPIGATNQMPIKITDGDNITLGAKADNRSTATDTTAVSAMSVLKEISYMEQNPASRAVTGTVTAKINGKDAAAFEQLTIDATVGGIALTAYAANTKGFITVETASIRFTVNGTAPTTTVGHIADPGDVIELDSLADMAAFRAIRTTSVSAVITATYSAEVT